MLGLVRSGVLLSFHTVLFSDSIPQVHRVFQYTNDFEEFWYAARDSTPRSSGLSVVSRANRNHFGSDLPFLMLFARWIFRYIRPALPIPFLFWGRSVAKRFFKRSLHRDYISHC